MKKIMGYEKFVSKKGTRCCAVSIVEEMQPRSGLECAGVKAFPVMIFGDDVDKITEKAIGGELCGYFGYSNGTCTVQSLEVRLPNTK
ncbi:MAG: hypothetical protein K2N94_09560 [Lachnospiraceae bacterium]|nr:hypothetical protein [Lachnospiraceae bacterium]